MIATLLMGGRTAAPDAESYSGVDRALHRVAFATYEVQADLADIEDRLFASHLGSITNQRPVFITSLPRAGTTLLLECCAALDEFASHTYRDMPFVMIPCLWSSFSGAFRREGQLKPRAHGIWRDVCEANSSSAAQHSSSSVVPARGSDVMNAGR